MDSVDLARGQRDNNPRSGVPFRCRGIEAAKAGRETSSAAGTAAETPKKRTREAW